jgi:hypothetical protein
VAIRSFNLPPTSVFTFSVPRVSACRGESVSISPSAWPELRRFLRNIVVTSVPQHQPYAALPVPRPLGVAGGPAALAPQLPNNRLSVNGGTGAISNAPLPQVPNNRLSVNGDATSNAPLFLGSVLNGAVKTGLLVPSTPANANQNTPLTFSEAMRLGYLNCSPYSVSPQTSLSKTSQNDASIKMESSPQKLNGPRSPELKPRREYHSIRIGN